MLNASSTEAQPPQTGKKKKSYKKRCHGSGATRTLPGLLQRALLIHALRLPRHPEALMQYTSVQSFACAGYMPTLTARDAPNSLSLRTSIVFRSYPFETYHPSISRTDSIPAQMPRKCRAILARQLTAPENKQEPRVTRCGPLACQSRSKPITSA